MKVLVINCGSSSLKYQVLDMTTESDLCSGVVERIGIEGGFIKHKFNGEKTKIEQELTNHNDAIALVVKTLTEGETKVLESLDEIDVIGHRVVHGGEVYNESIIIDENVKAKVKELFDLAPLHNPANLMGIEACEKLMPGKKNVAVFDTAFHQTMPKASYIYSIPYEFYEKYGIRKYGFHGSSHRYIAGRTAEILEKPITELNIVNCHLGNGASLCAIKEGVSVDTSMGFTPLEGLTMGTRAGDVDSSVIQFLMDKEGMSINEVMNILNKKSGILGISGVSSDCRDVEIAAENGNELAQLALDKLSYQVKRYLGAYMAVMDGVDAITFTGGIGEMGAEIREAICANLEHLGIELDKDTNKKIRGKEAIISTPNSKIKVMVVPTNEELMIARDSVELVKKLTIEN